MRKVLSNEEKKEILGGTYQELGGDIDANKNKNTESLCSCKFKNKASTDANVNTPEGCNNCVCI